MITETMTAVEAGTSISSTLIDFAWIVYLIDVLSPTDYNDVMGLLLVFSIIVAIILSVIPEIKEEECTCSDDTVWFKIRPNLLKIKNTGLILGIIYFIYYQVVPNQETAYQLTGLVVAAKIAENPEVKDLTGTGFEILDKKLQIYSTKLTKELEQTLAEVGK